MVLAMFQADVPLLDLVLRAVVVYGFVSVMLRLGGNKQLGDMYPADLVLILLVSNSVQNSMNAGDNSLVGGLVSAAVLFLINYLISKGSNRFKFLSRVLEGTPKILVHNGKLNSELLKKENLSREELLRALRANGLVSIDQARYVILEPNGKFSVIPLEK